MRSMYFPVGVLGEPVGQSLLHIIGPQNEQDLVPLLGVFQVIKHTNNFFLPQTERSLQ